jgi:hypothetical protein
VVRRCGGDRGRRLAQPGPEARRQEIFIGNCASKLDEKTGEIKDEATRGFIAQQLAAFVTFIARVAPKG